MKGVGVGGGRSGEEVTGRTRGARTVQRWTVERWTVSGRPTAPVGAARNNRMIEWSNIDTVTFRTATHAHAMRSIADPLVAEGGQRRFAVEERVGMSTSCIFYQKHPAYSKPRMNNVKKAGPHSIRFAEGDDTRTDLTFGHFGSSQRGEEGGRRSPAPAVDCHLRTVNRESASRNIEPQMIKRQSRFRSARLFTQLCLLT